MSTLAYIAMGFAILRGLMLTVLTVPWLTGKMRRPETKESERSLLWMVGSRTILLGLAILLLAFRGRPEALALALLGDGVLQLFDAGLAVAQRKRTLAFLPAILCLLDGLAGFGLLMR